MLSGISSLVHVWAERFRAWLPVSPEKHAASLYPPQAAGDTHVVLCLIHDDWIAAICFQRVLIEVTGEGVYQIDGLSHPEQIVLRELLAASLTGLLAANGHRRLAELRDRNARPPQIAPDRIMALLRLLPYRVAPAASSILDWAGPWRVQPGYTASG
jgi:hypothetical protein